MSLLCGSRRGSEERPRHCCGTKLRGDWDGRRSRGEGFETTAARGPQLRLCLGAASPGPVYGSFALGQRGGPRRPAPHSAPLGINIFVSRGVWSEDLCVSRRAAPLWQKDRKVARQGGG